MSDDFHRPTLTFPNKAYNATHVRLYGVSFANTSTVNFANFIIDNYNLKNVNKDELASTIAALDKLSAVPLDLKEFGVAILLTDTKRELSGGVIVGYSFEGHCYDLPKPKVMLIPALPIAIPSDDCGYERKNRPGGGIWPQEDNNYRLWIVDKLDQCVELDMNQGFVEQLVLEANLPGKRSPTMYAGKMMLGHRSGRLSE